MNKKVITLCAAALLFGANGMTYAQASHTSHTATAVTISDNVTLANGVKFYLVSGGSYVTTEKVAKLNVVTPQPTVPGIDNAAVFVIQNMTAVNGGYEFDLYVDGVKVAVAENLTSLATDAAVGTKTVSRFASKTRKASTFEIVNSGVNGQVVPVLAGTPSTAEVELCATELNEYNAFGTTLSFATQKNLVGNEFKEVIPVELNADKVVFVKGKKADIEAFVAAPDNEAKAKKVQVLALSNTADAYQISGRGTYEGLKLRWMPGENLQYAATTVSDGSIADSTSYAEFTVKALDVLNNETEVELAMSPEGNAVYVKGVTPSASDANTYVTSINQTYNVDNYAALVNPTLGDNSYLDPSILLKDTKNVVSIYFTSGAKSQDYDETEQYIYHKYLVANDVDEATVLPANEINFINPAAQWVVSGFDGKYTFTLTNRATLNQVVLKLQPNGDEGGYKVVSATGGISEITDLGETTVTAATPLAGTSVKFKTLSTTANDGCLVFTENQMKNGVFMTVSGKSDIYGEQTYYVSGDASALTVNIDGKNKFTFIPEASEAKTQNISTAAYLKDGKVVLDKDTLEAPAYILKSEDAYFQAATLSSSYYGDLTVDATKANAVRVIGILDGKGGYTLYAAGREGATVADPTITSNQIATLPNHLNVLVDEGDLYLNGYAFADFETVNFGDVVNTINSLEAKTRYASLDNVLGSITYQLNKNAINEGILKDTAIFRLNVVDTAAIEKGKMAEFYISKYVGQGDSVRMFMFNAADSMRYFDEGDAQEVTNTKYILEGTTSDPKVVFQPASLIAADTLVAGADTLTAASAAAYKFNIVSTGNEGEYTINSTKGGYVYALNGRLGLTTDPAQAFKFTLGADQMPTANETIAASEVTVAATTGAVVVKGAAGKSVVVTNILGQTLANTVIISDNATIAVPAGIVVVAVEGEEAAKVVVK